MYNLLLTENEILDYTESCAVWLDTLASSSDVVVCPVMQSGFRFSADVLSLCKANFYVDTVGVIRHSDFADPEDLYIYKCVDANIVKDKTVVLLDVLVSSGTTITCLKKFISQMTMKRVYTASLLKRQFCSTPIDWTGYKIADEIVYGYGMDLGSRYRELNSIYYE